MIDRLLNKLIGLLNKLKSKEVSPIISQETVFTNQLPQYAKYTIGDWTYGKPEVLDWNDGTTLNIGKYCSIADGVKIFLGGEHYHNYVSTYPFNKLFLKEISNSYLDRKTKGDVCIGHDVWIGNGAYILSGISVGNGAVVGAAAVVTKDVPPYAIVAGNPAAIIKFRFEKSVVDKIESLSWWDWNEEEIKSKLSILMNTPDKF